MVDTIANVFTISQSEYFNILQFIRFTSSDIKLNDHILLCTKNLIDYHARNILIPALEGTLSFLKIDSVNLFFMRYEGLQELQMNGVPIMASKNYLLASGSIVRLPEETNLYYSDVASHYLEGDSQLSLSFNVDDLRYRFKTGNEGLKGINLSESGSRLVAIMGASGAGKSTLLSNLCGLLTPSSGQVLLNGVKHS